MGGVVSFLLGGAQEEEGEDVSLLDLVNPAMFQDTHANVLWHQMRLRLRSHPHEAAAYARSIDSSPLHRAMQLAQSRNTILPLDLVQLFLEAYEEAAFDKPLSGETLLLVATYGASLDVQDDMHNEESLETIKLIMKYNPDAIFERENEAKLLPAHLVRNNVEIAKLLLNAYPQGAVVKDAHGRIPLFYCCSGTDDAAEHARQQDDDQEEENVASPRLALTHPDVVAQLVETAKTKGLVHGGILIKDRAGKTPLDQLCEQIDGELGDNDTQKALSNAASSPRVAQLWQSLIIMVKAVSQQDDNDTFRMVHAIIALNCSPAIVAEALRLYPEQASERDAKGCTPLMLAALSLDTVHPGVICTLLKFFPDAACMTDADGRLPIDIIAESNKYDEELWEALVKAEPRAVDTRDLRDKMFPFMTAAMSDKSNTNVVYKLLRSKPHVLSYFNLE